NTVFKIRFSSSKKFLEDAKIFFPSFGLPKLKNCLFSQLHAKVRANQESCHHSMQCLIHLASLMGEVFLPQKDQPSSTTDQQHDTYVKSFVQHTLVVFQR